MRIAANLLRYSISNGALTQKDLPRKLKVLNWGDNPCVKGAVRVTALSAERVPITQKAKGWDRIALDYEHNTLPGTPAFERGQEPRAVAAYGVVVCVPGDGVFLDDIQWTPHGEKFAREYVDLSPAPLQVEDGTVIGFHSVALCRHGAVDGLQFYSVELSEGDKAMDWKKWLCGFLGAPEDIADAELQDKMKAKIQALCAEALSGIAAQVTEAGAKIAALTAAVPEKAGETIAALSAEVTTLKTQVATFNGEIEKRDRQDIVRGAAMEGKVIPLSAEQLATTPLATLREMVGKLQVTVPLDQRTPERIQALSADGAVLTALETVARACGVDPKMAAKA